jgi:hypothetical protein
VISSFKQVDLAAREPELLVVPDTGDAHPAVLHLLFGRGEPAFEIALAGAERRCRGTRLVSSGRS